MEEDFFELEYKKPVRKSGVDTELCTIQYRNYVDNVSAYVNMDKQVYQPLVNAILKYQAGNSLFLKKD